jgi:membrane associated rhomboid family serine protease
MGVIYTQEGLGVRVGRSWVTTALVAINVIAYLLTSWENSLLEISERWLWWGGFVPAYLADPRQAYRLLTSMFLHANLIHIFFNMLYLYNFGKLVEQALGSKRYLALYFLSGLAAELFHTAFIPVEGPVSAVIPAIGASGAISGVLGAYLLLFPGSKLSMCFFYLYFPGVRHVERRRLPDILVRWAGAAGLRWGQRRCRGLRPRWGLPGRGGPAAVRAG